MNTVCTQYQVYHATKVPKYTLSCVSSWVVTATAISQALIIHSLLITRNQLFYFLLFLFYINTRTHKYNYSNHNHNCISTFPALYLSFYSSNSTSYTTGKGDTMEANNAPAGGNTPEQRDHNDPQEAEEQRELNPARRPQRLYLRRERAAMPKAKILLQSTPWIYLNETDQETIVKAIRSELNFVL